MAFDLVTMADKVLAGAFLARATYGGEYIDPAFQVGGDGDAEKADNYRGYIASNSGWTLLDRSDLPTFNDRNGDSRFTSGGLFDSRAFTLTTNSYDAQGLLAVEGGDTLVLAFRGTDGQDPAVLSGQAFTGQGVAANYKAFKPLINAAYDFIKAHPEITNMVVSGHSLGGAMADVFALVDAARFRDLLPGDLSIVSLASSGVPRDLPVYLGGFDAGVATFVDKVIVNEFGIKVKVKFLDSLNMPDGYISIANTEDRAHFADKFPDIPEAAGLVPIVTLKDNLHFGGDLLFRVPNIDNTDVRYYDPLDHPLDFRGMGAQHNSALLWTNLEGLIHDDLFFAYNGQRLTAGITDYLHARDIDGSSIPLFEGYIHLGDKAMMDDKGDRTLIGNAARDYILGFDGNDRLEGRDGNDLLSGGKGDDHLLGGRGSDTLSGGGGRDLLEGGVGNDTFYYSGAWQSQIGTRADIISGFTHGQDIIDVADIDANNTIAGDQAFTFIGTDAFTGVGQIRVVQFGDEAIVRFNNSSKPGYEMAIVLRHFDAALLTAHDFIL